MSKPSRGILNRNPGNIRHGDQWQGLALEQNDPDFCAFISFAYGIRALLRLLQTYRTKHKLTTVRQIVSRWAPVSENDTAAYIRHVCQLLGVEPDQELGDSTASYIGLGRAIARHECGPEADTIPAADWAEGASLAFNAEQVVAAPPPPVPPIQTIHDIVTGKEPAMPAPFLVLAANALSALLPTLIRMKSSSPQGELNAQIAEKVVPIVQAAVGATNAQEAVERVANDPAAFQAAEKAVRENYLELVEAGGGGIQGAREYSLAAADKPLSKQPAFVISLVLMIFPLLLCFDVFVGHPGFYTPEMKTQVITAILVVIGMVGAFWLGSSQSSRTKDEALAKALR